MEKYIDLHSHSTYSDGTLTPEELVKLASDTGLSAIALTDHDTVDGLSEAIEAGNRYGVEVITGIEFSIENDYPIHMLGLNFRYPCDEIKSVLDALAEERVKRIYVTLDMLKNIGIDITEDDVLNSMSSKVPGRSHIAAAMVKKGYINSIGEGFKKYLGFGKPAYAPRKKISPSATIDLIHSCGGKAIMAHLHQTGKNYDEVFGILKELKRYGLDGIEGYYTEYTDEMNRIYREMARELDLILSGGSDFHGTNKDGYALGRGNGDLFIPYELLDKIRA